MPGRPGARILARTAAAAGLAFGAARLGGRIATARVERQRNVIHPGPPRRVSAAARDLHRSIAVADLHADTLLWGRDVNVRADRGHVDVPRLIEGNVALQAFAVCAKVPRNLNLERNEDRADDVTLLALAQFWPPATWRSHLARAIYQADRLRRMADRSAGRLWIIETAADLGAHLARRAADPGRTAALLTIEGAYVLEGDPANVEVLADAGFRMMSPTHFLDNPLAGSAHGVEKGGLTALGREMLERMEARGMLVDVAHASIRTIDDVLAVARRPVVSSHGGVRATADNPRNLSDDHVRAIARTGGLVGIGFWPTACGGEDAASIARSIAHAASIGGVDHVGLGSDFDGAVPVPFDAAGLDQLTDALLAEGFDPDAIRAVMGGNVIELLGRSLPGGSGW